MHIIDNEYSVLKFSLFNSQLRERMNAFEMTGAPEAATMKKLSDHLIKLDT